MAVAAYCYYEKCTEQCAVQLYRTSLTDKINKGFESGKYTGLILTDFQQAFDAIDNEILL